MKKAYERICDLSKRDNKTITEKTAKLFEEGGELAAEVLKITGKRPGKNSSTSEVLQEAVDVVQCAISVVAMLDVPYEDFLEMLDKKNDKWQSKYVDHLEK